MNLYMNYSLEIATLIGDIIDNYYPQDFLTKQNLKVELTEMNEDGQIISDELGKGRSMRNFSVCSWRDNRFHWHHTILGSLAELPIPRQKQIYQELDRIVSSRIEEELSSETGTKKTRTLRKPKGSKGETEQGSNTPTTRSRKNSKGSGASTETNDTKSSNSNNEPNSKAANKRKAGTAST